MNVISLVLWAAMAAQQTTTPQYVSDDIAAGSKIVSCNPVYAEPMDVPAIQGTKDEPCATISRNASGEWSSLKEGKCPSTAWTCADKSRIVLTAEDGSKHCIKFGGQ